jgi:hypothetical protein
MEKCCDACGEGILLPICFFSVSGLRCFELHRLSFTGCRWDIRWLSGRGKRPTFCVFPVFRVALCERVVTLAMKGNTTSGQVV